MLATHGLVWKASGNRFTSSSGTGVEFYQYSSIKGLMRAQSTRERERERKRERERGREGERSMTRPGPPEVLQSFRGLSQEGRLSRDRPETLQLPNNVQIHTEHLKECWKKTLRVEYDLVLPQRAYLASIWIYEVKYSGKEHTQKARLEARCEGRPDALYY